MSDTLNDSRFPGSVNNRFHGSVCNRRGRNTSAISSSFSLGLGWLWNAGVGFIGNVCGYEFVLRDQLKLTTELTGTFVPYVAPTLPSNTTDTGYSTISWDGGNHDEWCMLTAGWNPPDNNMEIIPALTFAQGASCTMMYYANPIIAGNYMFQSIGNYANWAHASSCEIYITNGATDILVMTIVYNSPQPYNVAVSSSALLGNNNAFYIKVKQKSMGCISVEDGTCNNTGSHFDGNTLVLTDLGQSSPLPPVYTNPWWTCSGTGPNFTFQLNDTGNPSSGWTGEATNWNIITWGTINVGGGPSQPMDIGLSGTRII